MYQKTVAGLKVCSEGVQCGAVWLSGRSGCFRVL